MMILSKHTFGVAGGVDNAQTVMAGAIVILMFKDSTLLKEIGGKIDITKEWTGSLLNRMSFSKIKRNQRNLSLSGR